MPEYKFVTLWKLDAPIDSVYAAIQDTAKWSSWWQNIESVEVLEQGEPSGMGRVERFTFRTELPYKLRFEARVSRIEPPYLLEGQARGELEGIGRWALTRQDDGTLVNYLWDVSTTRWWMNLLAPIARPLFARNHEAVMRNGGQALAKYLGVRLLSHDYIEADKAPANPKNYATI